jgi:hypothetical protein
LLKALLPRHGSNYEIDKVVLCTAVQMLQEQESTTLRLNESVVLKIKHNPEHKFSVECTSLAYNTDSVLLYLNKQRIPLHHKCIELSTQIQDHLGFLPFQGSFKKNIKVHIDDTFLADNSTIISKLTDILNQNLQKRISHTQLQQKVLVYSHTYASQLLKLAAIFCATAFENKACMWHISQGLISDFHQDAQVSLYNNQEPEKQHVTLLLKGNTINERIMRINLAVRIFPKDDCFTKQIMPTIMPMNCSSCDTSVMVLTGVNSQVAAAIYINPESEPLNKPFTSLALDAYLPPVIV